jgi:hypothetical protein
MTSRLARHWPENAADAVVVIPVAGAAANRCASEKQHRHWLGSCISRALKATERTSPPAAWRVPALLKGGNRWAHGRNDQLPTLIAELVRREAHGAFLLELREAMRQRAEHQRVSLMGLGKRGDCGSTSPRSLDELAQLRTHTAHYSPVVLAPLSINSSQADCALFFPDEPRRNILLTSCFGSDVRH